MRPSTLRYYIGESLAGIRRSTSLMSLGTIIASFLVLGMLGLVFINIYHISQFIESRVEIRAFLKDGLSASDIRGLQSRLSAVPGVKRVSFISRDEGLKRLKAQLQDKRFLLDVMEENPLPDAFDIELKDPRNVKSIAATISRMPGVDEVNYGQGFAETLFTTTRFILIVSMGLFAIIASLVVFIIGNAVRLSIFARRREIEIMKLVGATDWFVRWPFLLEGIMIGVAGAGLSCAVLVVLYQTCLDYVGSGMPFLPLVSDPFVIAATCLALLFAGAVMGATASWVFMKRHLRV
ncbi:MAG TPA: ABC transporter permease [Firmicutes bacterium]|nr:ABC transporter permease [Bacillota bacterium]